MALRILFSVADLILLSVMCVYEVSWFGKTCQPKQQPAQEKQPKTEKQEKQREEVTVVVVGASFAGLSLLRELEELIHTLSDVQVNILLIDQRSYFEYIPGLLRVYTQPSHHDQLIRPIPTQPAGVNRHYQYVQGRVTLVEDTHVEVWTDRSDRSQTDQPSHGETRRISYDYVVIATGIDYRQPVTPSLTETSMGERNRVWVKEAEKLKNAESVIVLGGGAVGTELAAEIISHTPDKKVTIIDGAPKLLPLFPASTGQYTENWFQKRGVELILGSFTSDISSDSVTLSDGRIISADVVYVCFGMRPNSGMLVKSSLFSCLNKRGEIATNSFFQVQKEAGEGEGSVLRNVFAVGDVASPPTRDIKQAYNAEMHGIVAAKNIVKLIQHRYQNCPENANAENMPKNSTLEFELVLEKETPELFSYPQSIAGSSNMPFIYVVSLGKYDGSLGFNTLVVNGFVAALLKWVIEWTKVNQMSGRPVGSLIWKFGDSVSFFISRYILKPKQA